MIGSIPDNLGSGAALIHNDSEKSIIQDPSCEMPKNIFHMKDFFLKTIQKIRLNKPQKINT